MNVKQHLCGVAVAYEEFRRTQRPSLATDKGRPNGSLYNRQKRSIADATEYLRLKLRGNRSRKPLIFCLTTPGEISLANAPKFISCFIENMRANYELGEYVWVREHTKKGFPHFHFIAEWNTSAWFFQNVVYRGKLMPRITAISLYWSGLFGSNATNSIRLGSYHPVTKKRTLYVTADKQAWYLCKYIGKNIGDNGFSSYLCEAGFPATQYKKAVRGFAISEMLSEWSAPALFRSVFVYEDTGEVFEIMYQTLADRPRAVKRMWESDNKSTLLEMSDEDLERWEWKWTGHGETYIGFERGRRTHVRPRKGGNKSD